MSGTASKTLFHPFETEALFAPAGTRAIFLGAAPGFRPPSGFGSHLDAVQGFRPDFLALEREGANVRPEAEGRDYDLALILLDRHRGQNEAWLREALGRTRPGATIAVAGTKQEGVDSFRKRVSGKVTIDRLSKHHGVVFWFSRPAEADLEGSDLMRDPDPTLVEDRFHTAPGMFSHDRIDPASRLLAENLPLTIAGRVADFGAGWGYLSSEVLARDGGITGLDLFEADFASLEAAKRNLAEAGASLPKGFFWRDLLQEKVERNYDFIVMNPPFHQGRAAEPGIGQGMIRAASAALKPGGRLFLVANRGLPYEVALASGFAASGETCRDDRFKVLWAKR